MVELILDFTPHLKKLEDLSKKPWLHKFYSNFSRSSGKDFEGYDIYTPDQDARKIDWAATARSDKTLVRKYVEERDINNFIVLDVSSTMFYSSTKKLKCEYAAEIVNSLAFSMILSGNYVALYMISDRIELFLAKSNDRTHYFKIIKSLSDSRNYGGKRSVKKLLSELAQNKDSGSLFIISDFINFTKEEIDMLVFLRKKYEIFTLLVRDRMERFLPTDLNAVCIENMESGKSIIVNIKQVNREYREAMERDERRLERAFLRHDIGFGRFYTHAPFESKIVELFNRRVLS